MLETRTMIAVTHLNHTSPYGELADRTVDGETEPRAREAT
jgi:hypothetical protein